MAPEGLDFRRAVGLASAWASSFLVGVSIVLLMLDEPNWLVPFLFYLGILALAFQLVSLAIGGARSMLSHFWAAGNLVGSAIIIVYGFAFCRLTEMGGAWRPPC